MKRSLLLMLLFLPLLLANKECERATTWGPTNVSRWGGAHPFIKHETQCKMCHPDGRTRQWKPKWHTTAWRREHGKITSWMERFGTKSQSVCYVCHKESWCAGCHQQEPPAFHTRYWRLKGHGVSVGLDRNRCLYCHRVDFCERCHQSTKPQDHVSGVWGKSALRHCVNCHYPVESAGAQRCNACHQGTPSHALAPRRANNDLHVDTAQCRDCHVPLRHPDNGMACITCHAR